MAYHTRVYRGTTKHNYTDGFAHHSGLNGGDTPLDHYTPTHSTWLYRTNVHQANARLDPRRIHAWNLACLMIPESTTFRDDKGPYPLIAHWESQDIPGQFPIEGCFS